ncbi:MAG TPA: hypothetical protein VM261_29895 [Kofleriaceae bacterium]|nr:hypothetical protein [Kofleriaceae bacterium]
MSEPSYSARRETALAALASGDAESAFREFRWTLWYPRAVPTDELVDGLGVMARIFAAMGHRELAERAAHSSVDSLDPDGLYQLGYQLVEEGLPAIAATVLARCLEIVPGSEEVVTELVSALERQLAYADARRVLESNPALLESSFLCRYLRAFNAAMSGDLATVRAAAPTLAPREAVHEIMAQRIDSIVARADRATEAGCALDLVDLRGWHFVLGGGMLGHLSPHGFEEGMHGRYAWVQDTLAMVKMGLDRLRTVLRVWGISPPCVYAPPGRDHEIIGEAAARVLGLERVPWPSVGVPAPGLVVVYDLAGVERKDLERLLERREGQVLYAHATGWTEDGAIGADLTTVLHQSIVSPWEPQLVIDPATGQARTGAADARSIEELGAAVAASDDLRGDDIARDDLPGLERLASIAGPPAPGRRERAWAGGPVVSNRFL